MNDTDQVAVGCAIGAAVAVLVAFLGSAFACWSIDPGTWSEFARGFFLFCAVVAGSIGALLGGLHGMAR